MNHWSTKQQLSIALVVTSLTSVLLSACIFMGYKFYSDRQQLIYMAHNQADKLNSLIEDNGAWDKPEIATELLKNELSDNSYLELAAIYKNSVLFVQYPKVGQIPKIISSRAHYFADGKLYSLVVLKNPPAETLVVFKLKPFYQGFMLSFVTLLGASAIALTLASILSIHITRNLIAPEHELAKLAKCIRLHGHTIEDHEGIADQIQDLLDQITQRDTKLQLEKDTLQAEVETRAEELEDALDKAEKASQVKSSFLANISHELRTPLTAIQVYTDLVLDDLEEGITRPELHSQDLKKVLTASEHLLHLIDDILDVARIESGKTVLNFKEENLEDLLGQVYLQAHPLTVTNANIYQQHFDFDSNMTITTDRLRLVQVLLNMLSNASKFTVHGSITLRVYKDLTDIIFQVEDTGIGMTQEQMDKVWSRFEQADTFTSKKYGGTGLGLSLIKELTKLLHGDVSMTSALGVGTTLTVRLPLNNPTT